MNVVIPDLTQFELEVLRQTSMVENLQTEVNLRVDLLPCQMNRRVVVGLFDESSKRGIAVAIYPATGEVCDLTNGGGVIGYLAESPLRPGFPVSCDLTLHRFGSNFVCSVRIQGEIFLYPAFSWVGSTRLAAFVGNEAGSAGDNGIAWSHLRLDVIAQPVAA